jgi:pentatricopeptide repeat protein
MDLYDRAIRPLLHETRNSLYDCVALLWRYQIYGCSTGPLAWGELSDRAAELSVKPGFAFNDVHAAMAFAAAGDDRALDRLIDGLRDLDAKGHPSAGPVVLPIVRGVAAFGRGDYVEAVRLIDPVYDRIVGVGGSNAQREVLEDTLIEACLRAGHFDRAEELLRDRLSRRPRARDFYWLGRAQAATGRSDAARASRDEARSRWPTADPDAAEPRALAALA